VNKCDLKLNDSIHFKTDRAEIESRSFELLDSVVAVLASHDQLNIQIEGHTDNQGSAAYNKGLSQRRAEAVVAYLVKKGIARSRLTARGFGLEKPIADNGTEDGRAQNRRVVFAIQGCQGDPS
jgi:OOP family OmpA-OmpF porin